MYDQEALAELRERWAENEKHAQEQIAARGERKERFLTEAGIPVQRVYTPLDNEGQDYLRDLGLPGEYPFTRGIYPGMYRSFLWHMRQSTGFGLPEDTNARNKYLIAHGGQLGFYGNPSLTIVLDMPTHFGLDSDDPRAEGQVGKVGAAIDTVEDIEIIMRDIPMDRTFCNLNCHALGPLMAALYVAAAERQGVPHDRISGSTTNDPIQNHVAEKIYVLPLLPSLRLSLDAIEYAVRHLPRWTPIAICGEQYRDSGADAVQELSFCLLNGAAYVEALLERGLDIDEFAPRLSFFLTTGTNLLEEAAKYRAGRRIWAKIMREKGAKNPRSGHWRLSVCTSGIDLYAQQPHNNIIRVTIQALASVLGGCLSLYPRSYDEGLAIPTEEAATLALRTGQIVAEESGVADTVDPLGGSYFVERLTDELERRVWENFQKIEELGKGAKGPYQGRILRGVLEAAESGYFEREAARSMLRRMREIESGQRVVVGVNKYTQARETPVEIMRVDPRVQEIKVQRLRELKARRNAPAVARALEEVGRVARSTENIMPALIAAFQAQATWGEVTAALKEVWGEYRRSPLRLWTAPGAPPPASGPSEGRPIRVLMAGIGLDGHEVGALVVSRSLSEAGVEVIYIGANQSPASIVRTALQEDVHAIGLSSMVGAHGTFVPRVLELLRESQAQDVPVIVGGIVPPEDIAVLKAAGVKEVFSPGTATKDIVAAVKAWACPTAPS